MFEISNRAVLVYHHAVQISTDFIDTYLARRLAKVKGNMGAASAVVYNKALTVLTNGNLSINLAQSFANPATPFFA
jgi:hypothetical protein